MERTSPKWTVDERSHAGQPQREDHSTNGARPTATNERAANRGTGAKSQEIYLCGTPRKDGETRTWEQEKGTEQDWGDAPEERTARGWDSEETGGGGKDRRDEEGQYEKSNIYYRAERSRDLINVCFLIKKRSFIYRIYDLTKLTNVYFTALCAQHR